jgi:hypothetical protein
MHEDNGISYNVGDGVPVRGVNKFLKMRVQRENDDSLEEQDEKNKEAAATKAQSDSNDKTNLINEAAAAASKAKAL